MEVILNLSVTYNTNKVKGSEQTEACYKVTPTTRRGKSHQVVKTSAQEALENPWEWVMWQLTKKN